MRKVGHSVVSNLECQVISWENGTQQLKEGQAAPWLAPIVCYIKCASSRIIIRHMQQAWRE